MLINFKTYQVSLEFFKLVRAQKVEVFMRDQFLRAASSICLNLAEGSGKNTPTDQRKFYSIALGSLRECQAICDLHSPKMNSLSETADQLGAMIYRLIHPRI